MRVRNFYEEDAIELFTTYLNKNNKDISRTLKELENEKKLPLFFMNYYKSHEDFMEKFNISRDEYFKSCSQRWCGLEIYRPR